MALLGRLKSNSLEESWEYKRDTMEMKLQREYRHKCALLSALDAYATASTTEQPQSPRREPISKQKQRIQHSNICSPRQEDLALT
jgi:hypothetical protein